MTQCIRKMRQSFIMPLFLFVMFAVLFSTSTVYASNANYYESKGYESAYAGIPVDLPITIDSKCNVRIGFTGSTKENITIEVIDSANELVTTAQILGETAVKNRTDGAFEYQDITIPFSQGGNYIFRIRTETFLTYKITVGPTTATISKSSTTVTKGFSTTLKVTNGAVKSWTTSNSKVATVKNGKVSAKKVGKATITAKLKDGKKLTCKVTVKDNFYTEKKITVKNSSSGLWGQVYKAYYSKGKLILKVRIVNHTNDKYNSIGDITINMYDKNGDLIGKYNGANKKGNLGENVAKEFTFTIKKPKKKNADLRLATTTVEGTLAFQ